jgi:uncharacterized protein (DUF1810 family)
MQAPREFDHFLQAQEAVYPQVCRELAAGEKQSHWMWFIFPQLAGLGFSAISQKFALHSVEEAARFSRHPVLGERLRQCTRLVLDSRRKHATEIFGAIDALKFRSCMTLFSIAAPDEPLFRQALEHFFSGLPDPLTVNLLGRK